MSNEKTTNPTENIASSLDHDDEADPVITRKQRLKIRSLGYKDIEINRMGAEEALKVLELKKYKPGTKMALKQANKIMAAAGLPQASDSITDEAVNQRKARSLQPTPGVAVTLDAFTNNCLKGDDPLDAIIMAHEEKFPGMRFRLINPDLPVVAGPQFQQVYDADRKAITQGGMNLGYMPDAVYEEAFVKPNLERAARMSGRIKDPKAMSEMEDGGDLTLSKEQSNLVPLQGDGLRIERSTLSRA